MIFFSVQDLFGYLKAHATMSGIQRVQAGIAMHAIAEHGDDCGFVLNDLTENYVDGDFLLIDNPGLQAIILYASSRTVDHETLRDMLKNCEERAAIVRPGAGDTVFLLGAFWGHGNTLDRYVTAKRNGALIGAYVYDIIPVTHPEFCDATLSRDFSMSIGELALVVDFIFTISDFTRHTLSDLFRQCGARDVPMRTVPLAHLLTVTEDIPEAWPSALRTIEGKRYVAYVSTVEGRKNHLYVVRVWQELIALGVDVPDLVFVGRSGWRVGGLADVLDGTRYLDGRVHVVRDLSDAELSGIYARCLFTAFTSFVEGWGLPVGESLVQGVPCVASSTSSIPEVGGDFVDYVDPVNLRDGIAVFRRMIEDEPYRLARREAIARDFTPRTWYDVGLDFFAKLHAAMADGCPAREIIARLRPGERFAPGLLVTEPIRMADYIASPMRLALAASFRAIEPFGTWMRVSRGDITFQTDYGAGHPITIYLELCATPAAEEALLASVTTTGMPNSAQQWYAVVPQRRNLIRVEGQVGQGGVCTVVLQMDGAMIAQEGDGRLLGIGLVAIGYAASADAAARDRLVEHFIFRDMTASQPRAGLNYASTNHPDA